MTDLTTYDDAQAALFPALTELDTNDRSLYFEPVQAGRVRVHSRRRFYIDPVEGHKHINPSVYLEPRAAGEFSYRNDANTIKVEIKSEGEVWTRLGPYGVRVRLASVQREQDGGTVDEATTAVKPTTVDTDTNKVRVMQAVGSNLEFEYEVLPGGVKETITVHSKPNLGTSDLWAIVWDWQSLGLTPQLSADKQRIGWKDAQDNFRIVFRSLKVYDAEGTEFPAQYRLSANKLGVVLRASDMESAVYPLTIDPTFTTDQADTTENARVDETSYNGTGRGYYKSLLKTTLPDLTGYTVTGATLETYCYFSGNVETQYFDIYCAIPTTSWTSASSLSTINTVFSELGTATATNQTATTTGWKFYDISGSVGNDGIVDIYNSDSTPDPCTIAYHWVSPYNDGTPVADNATSTASVVGEFPSRIAFRTEEDTNYPYLEIDYEAPPASGYDRRLRERLYL